MRVLVDNGHGIETPGKRSPEKGFWRMIDGKNVWIDGILEWNYNREIAGRIVRALRSRGVNAELLVPESRDVSLMERVMRVNEACAEDGAENVILLSIHVNAAGNGDRWMNAKGWSCYTSIGNTRADDLATSICYEAAKNFKGHNLRCDWSDGDPDLESDFYILRKTRCAAVLTENFFMDNQDDVAYLRSDEGKAAIVRTHVEGVMEFMV